jgi:hypothetical protein
MIAFNLLARFRGSRLRSKNNRALRWQDFQLAFFAVFLKLDWVALCDSG